jgi:hypothetical protein
MTADQTVSFNDILDHWPAEQPGLKDAFLKLIAGPQSLPGTVLSLVSRPGVSHSVRAAATRNENRRRPVYGLIDVIASGSDPWFLSVCFYADEITDPEERGEIVPGQLFDEDGYCFDLDENDPDLLDYLLKRFDQAHQRASAA